MLLFKKNKQKEIKFNDYSDPTIREICHAAKNKNDPVHEEAIIIIAEYLSNLKIITQNSVLIPAPQHTGKAEYTREIAEIVSAMTGAKIADVLKCVPHKPLYDMKKKNEHVELSFFIRGKIPKSDQLYFVDNVIDTGYTYKTANRLFAGKLKPLVYAKS